MLTPLNSIFGESLFDDIFGDFTRPAKNLVRYNAPAPSVMKTDIKESDAGYELEIDLPGYRKENVKAELKEGYLTISAESRQENSQKDDAGKYIRRERYYGTCSRSFYVGDEVTEQDIKARFEDGILKVAIPKKEARPAVEESRFIAIEG
jgi:HSP20 family molecular chaperone IbpA